MHGLRLFVNLMAEVSALPLEKHGSPGESGTEAAENNLLSFVEATGFVQFIQEDWDAGG